MAHIHQPKHGMVRPSDKNNNKQYISEEENLRHCRTFNEPNARFQKEDLFIARQNNTSCQEGLVSYMTSSPKGTNDDHTSSTHGRANCIITSPISRSYIPDMSSEENQPSLSLSQLSSQPSSKTQFCHATNEQQSQRTGQATTKNNSMPHNLNSALHQKANPIISSRLQPIREKMNKAVFSITKNGFICMEFFKMRDGEERIYEVFWITPTGQEISISQVDPPQSFNMKSQPLCNRQNDTIKHYRYAELPMKYWKKYNYASDTVNIIQSRTPKVTVYNQAAKCTLMENSDFEVDFYDGRKTVRTKLGTKIIERGSPSLMPENNNGRSHLMADKKWLLDHTSQYEKMCTDLEVLLEEIGKTKGKPPMAYFPVTIGRRPAASGEQKSQSPNGGLGRSNPLACSQETTNKGFPITQTDRSRCPEITSASNHSYPSHRETRNNTSSCDCCSHSSGVSWQSVSSGQRYICRVFVRGLGWGMQLDNGELCIEYVDGDELTIQMSPMVVRYTDKQGNKTSFGECDILSSSVHSRLNTLPIIMEKLEAAQLM